MQQRRAQGDLGVVGPLEQPRLRRAQPVPIVIERVEAGHDQAWIPAAVAAEIVLLHERGRSRIGLPQLREAMEHVPSLRFLPLDLDQVDHFVSLTSIRDPFDRLIMSAARSLRADLISRDEKLAEGGFVGVVWA